MKSLHLCVVPGCDWTTAPVSWGNLEKHMKETHGRVKFSCTLCKTVFEVKTHGLDDDVEMDALKEVRFALTNRDHPTFEATRYRAFSE